MAAIPPNGDKLVKTNPDPTDAVREAMTLAIKNLWERVTDRFDSSEEAVKLARGELKDQLIAINSTINDKFSSNKELVDQLGKANAVALSAALETQKDLLKQLQISFDSSIKGVNEKIDRLTSRMDTSQGSVDGGTTVHQVVREDTRDRRTEMGNLWAIVFGIAGIAGAIVMAVIALRH
jgi:hypothetical protein